MDDSYIVKLAPRRLTLVQVLINFSLLVYSTFIYGLTKLCYGTLRAAEVEQLTERAWFAITETCLAMTIFKDELGAWFIVMFTSLVTGKVWGWIGDGRVEYLEQQPPANPRLFHARLTLSLAMSLLYDVLMLRYAVNTVVQEIKPTTMVMFLFEFAIVTTSLVKTILRYILSLIEQRIVKEQTAIRLAERRAEIRQERDTLTREIALAARDGVTHPKEGEPLPSESDIDEVDIEVPGWAAKGEWVLWLDLATGMETSILLRQPRKDANHCTDTTKLIIYVVFFAVHMLKWGFPIHIMRDVLMTARDFLKRLNSIIRYRRAIQEMNKYPDATQEELDQENTCIICREEMRVWNGNNPGAVDRIRPKKLPCNHILHLGCLKSWLERQQVCPTCRSPVTIDRSRRLQHFAADGVPPVAAPGQNPQQPQQQRQAGAPRVFNIGPIRLGFGANNQQVRDLAQQLGMPQAPDQAPYQAPGRPADQPTAQPGAHVAGQASSSATISNLQNVSDLLQQAAQVVHREAQSLQTTQQELQVMELLMAELRRLHLSHRNATAAPGQLAQPPPGIRPAQLPIHGNQFNIPNMPGTHTVGNTPQIVRQTTVPASSAIPAGSSELPDGVVLPPGWSLVPLQRSEAPDLRLRPATSQRSMSSSPTRTGERVPAQQQTQSMLSQVQSGTSRETDAPARDRAMPGTILQPNPTAHPNWGGSSQLFSSANGLEGLVRRNVPAPAVSSSSQRAVPTDGASSSESMENDKSKEPKPANTKQDTELDEDERDVISFSSQGRTATVEEADDVDA